MRHTLLIAALAFSGCGGLEPEIYQLVIDRFSLPDSCYSNGMQPMNTAITAPPGLMEVKVWDGPEGVPFMQIEQGGMSVDMGAAPNVAVSGVFTGKRGDKGWTFSSDASGKNAAANTTITTTTHAELTFERGGGTFKGTGALSSSSSCMGTLCPATSPSCSVSGIAIRGTRLATQFERAP